MKKLLLFILILLNMTMSANAVEVTLETKITGLYVAFFNRAADEGGLTYWTNRGNSSPNQSTILKELAAGFAQHPSFDRAYGDLSNQAFVEEIYKNALGREGDAPGVAYWTGRLNLPLSDPNYLSRSDFVSVFVEAALTFDRNDPQYVGLSEEDLNGAQLRHDLLANKAEVGLAFTHQLGTLSNVTDNENPESDPAYLASIKIISEVTEDHSTVETVLSFLESIRESENPVVEINQVVHFGVTPKESVSMILNIVTIMDNNVLMEGVLGAGQEAKITLLDINDTNLTLTVSTSWGDENISTYQLSDDKQTMSFLVPLNIVEGKLSLQTKDRQDSYSYKMLTANSPYLIALTPDAAQEGEGVTLTGKNLPSTSVQVVFADQNSSLTQTVIPSGNTVSFTVPQGASSGNIYLKIDQIQTNSLYLSIKRTIDVHVALSHELSFDASKISFILGLEEYTLDENYNVSLNVENQNMQYINAVGELPDGEAALLYSAVVLPDMTGTITVDANSTAVAWVFMGMSASIASSSDQWHTLYDQVAANTKVQAFANYINTLQKNDFDAWTTRSDETLKTKFQDALKDIFQMAQINRSMQIRSLRANDSTNVVVITQDPVNGNIYIDKNKLDKGNITLINDTKLYLSVEARSTKEAHKGEIVNGYRHVTNAILDSGGTLVGPQNWGLLDIASAKTLELKGEDSAIQVITSGLQINTNDDASKQDIANSLRARVIIEGLAIPSINTVLSVIIDTRLPNRTNMAKFLITGMRHMWINGDFLKQLTTEVSNSDSNIGAIADTFFIKPITNGLNGCIQVEGMSDICKDTIQGLAMFIGINGTMEAIKNKIIHKIEVSIAKSALKKAVVAIPVAGWIAEAVIVAYDNLPLISNTSTSVKSMYDMAVNPQQIDMTVDFPFEVSKVTPTCVALSPSDTLQRFYIYGGGFAEVDNTKPLVFIGTGDDKSLPYDLFVNEDATQMVTRFNVNELMDEGSWESHMFIKHMGISIMYDKIIRMVSREDEKLYFDSVVPDRAMLGQTITLNGCGWVPLERVKVFFDKDTDTKTEAEIISKTIDKIEVKIPQDAKSGLVYVTTGEDKKNAFRLFDVVPFGIFGINRESLEDETVFRLDGKGLVHTSGVYFIDHEGNKQEGSTSFITDTSIRVKTPSELVAGPVKLFVILSDGMKSNELVLKKIPERPKANPSSGVIGEGLSVSLSDEGDLDIYYMLNDNVIGTEKKYSTPVNLTLDDLKYTDLTLYAFTRVTINGVNYDSDKAEFYYYPCEEGDRYSNNQCLPPLPSCPLVLEESMVEEPGDTYFHIGIADTDNDGYDDIYIACEYYVSYKLRNERPVDHYQTNGVWKFYYESGQIRWEQSYKYDVLDGQWKSYYENGQVKDIWVYESGKANGVWKSYYENGQIYTEHIFENDKKTGNWTTYTDSGILLDEANYANDLLNGFRRSYYRTSGMLNVESNFINGLQEGFQKAYYESSILASIIPYTEDKKNGVGYYYNEAGSLTNETTYEYGKVKINIRWIDGVKYFVVYEDGNSRSHTVYFYDTGEIKFIIHHLFTRKDGQEVYYSKAGELRYCKIWENGIRIGFCME